jgi:hypothetical protein
MPEAMRRDMWKDAGRNDEERTKQWHEWLRREEEREAAKRKRKAELRGIRQKPVAKTFRTETPQRTAHDFPYLTSKDVPESGFRRATIIRPPEIAETKWGKRYRIALEFEDHDKRRWSMNDTTFWNLSDAYGADESKWVGKVVELKAKQFSIEGKHVTGIVGEPVQY